VCPLDPQAAAVSPLLRVDREFAAAFNQRAATILERFFPAQWTASVNACVSMRHTVVNSDSFQVAKSVHEHRLADYGARTGISRRRRATRS